ncbi:uncharacterized protein BO66DRAFT_201580 [Aspergillus aculeatinus CBS 121060]|uniref:Uncharacterized protein n=1 Tax=Aspergillus aculeatinus CBS 121060 TaxID=1448322 RepID=A0ACD1HJ77_9EURO|nr:hypothetical protein BO66DRAFT_201580 [Aspergillus aculeatinus CBS 121060]RAH73631.1 hypothetical protein BO66DRAFT_201580 [Aspergillus aculeatinus CBS 121060]
MKGRMTHSYSFSSSQYHQLIDKPHRPQSSHDSIPPSPPTQPTVSMDRKQKHSFSFSNLRHLIDKPPKSKRQKLPAPLNLQPAEYTPRVLDSAEKENPKSSQSAPSLGK